MSPFLSAALHALPAASLPFAAEGLLRTDLLAAAVGWAVFGVFVALCVVLAGFVVRFARQLHHRSRPPDDPSRNGRRP